MKEDSANCTSCMNENCFIKKHIHLEQMKNYIDKKRSFVCKKSLKALQFKGCILFTKEK